MLTWGQLNQKYMYAHREHTQQLSFHRLNQLSRGVLGTKQNKKKTWEVINALAQRAKIASKIHWNHSQLQLSQSLNSHWSGGVQVFWWWNALNNYHTHSVQQNGRVIQQSHNRFSRVLTTQNMGLLKNEDNQLNATAPHLSEIP